MCTRKDEFMTECHIEFGSDVVSAIEMHIEIHIHDKSYPIRSIPNGYHIHLSQIIVLEKCLYRHIHNYKRTDVKNHQKNASGITIIAIVQKRKT